MRSLRWVIAATIAGTAAGGAVQTGSPPEAGAADPQPDAVRQAAAWAAAPAGEGVPMPERVESPTPDRAGPPTATAFHPPHSERWCLTPSSTIRHRACVAFPPEMVTA